MILIASASGSKRTDPMGNQPEWFGICGGDEMAITLFTGPEQHVSCCPECFLGF